MESSDSICHPVGAHPAGTRGKPIRLLLVDDHPIVRRGLGYCLASRLNLKIAGEAGDGGEALRTARELLPDVILMDVQMPGMDGLAATKILREELPQIKVLVLTMCDSADDLLRIVQSGARGCVLKDAAPEDLLKAIETVAAGQTWFSPQAAQLALKQLVLQSGAESRLPLLSKREREVCARIASGLSSKEIAQALGVGLRTVDTHRERLMRKLGIYTVAGLTKFAIAKRLVSP
jgi:DNA-binding NarL/FixJ family response regulator